MTSMIQSKSTHERMKVVANMPTAEKASPMKTAAGTASSDHHDSTTPTASATR